MQTFVVSWSRRYQLGALMALPMIALVMATTGFASSGLRHSASFRPVLWGLVAAAGVLAVLVLIVRHALRDRLVVDERAVRIIGRDPLELGRPRHVSHGCYDQMVVMGRGLLGRRSMTHLWITVEGERGDRVVFLRTTPVGTRTSWPRARPPRDATMFDAGTTDMPALRAAIGALIT